MSIDALGEFGVDRMSEDEIQAFLSSQGSGILGLQSEPAPVLLPLSFGYDGEDRLYLTYVAGTDSEKVTLSERADSASFLVHSVDSPYNWESVRLTGKLEKLPQSEWPAATDALANAWRPAVFDDAERSLDVTIYEFRITERVGIKQLGLPDGFRE